MKFCGEKFYFFASPTCKFLIAFAANVTSIVTVYGLMNLQITLYFERHMALGAIEILFRCNILRLNVSFNVTIQISSFIESFVARFTSVLLFIIVDFLMAIKSSNVYRNS